MIWLMKKKLIEKTTTRRYKKYFCFVFVKRINDEAMKKYRWFRRQAAMSLFNNFSLTVPSFNLIHFPLPFSLFVSFFFVGFHFNIKGITTPEQPNTIWFAHLSVLQKWTMCLFFPCSEWKLFNKSGVLDLHGIRWKLRLNSSYVIFFWRFFVCVVSIAWKDTFFLSCGASTFDAIQK